jgi:murein DD-endopeptidase MepM/ murein hydrolase activator NlpD
VALLLALPALGGAASLSSRIQEKQRQVDAQRAKEGVLTSDIQGYSERIGALQSDITSLQAREARLQADLNGKLARLGAIQRDLRTERARLARLRVKLAEGERLLAARLVELYKADSPDLVTVVLDSDGFAELLENSEFARRIGRQDNRIIVSFRNAKRESNISAARLAGLEADARQIAAVVEDRRDEVAAVKGDLEARRDEYARARDRKNTVLASVREVRHHHEGELAELQKEQAEVQARLAGLSPDTIGPQRVGGQLGWPVNGPVSSPFGQRWGRLHAGIDIPVPEGTPVRAAASGSVAIAGWMGGYGNYTCINHGGGLSTCYGHQSRIGVSVGQSVSQGSVIGASGNTGNSTGPHMHFEVRVNGVPVDPMGYL